MSNPSQNHLRPHKPVLAFLFLGLSLAFSGCGGGGNDAAPVSKTELAPGTKAPELQVGAWLNSETLTLEKLRGHYVLIEFCLSTCQACKDAVPLMADIHSSFHDKGLTLMSLSYEEPDIIKNCAASYPAVVWPIGASCTAYIPYGVVSFPHCFVIHPSGTIAWEGKPTTELKTFLEGQFPPK